MGLESMQQLGWITESYYLVMQLTSIDKLLQLTAFYIKIQFAPKLSFVAIDTEPNTHIAHGV
jgi:hypothetical protein